MTIQPYTSKQQVFDLVLFALRKQGTRSLTRVNLELTCAYRGEGGVKCAAGHLIPNELYEDDMEGKPISLLLDRYPQVAELFSEEASDPAFLSDLQACHDQTPGSGAGFLDGFNLRMERLAARHCLHYSST